MLMTENQSTYHVYLHVLYLAINNWTYILIQEYLSEWISIGRLLLPCWTECTMLDHSTITKQTIGVYLILTSIPFILTWMVKTCLNTTIIHYDLVSADLVVVVDKKYAQYELYVYTMHICSCRSKAWEVWITPTLKEIKWLSISQFD